MKAGKITGLIVGGLVVLVLIAAFLIPHFVNPNDFKPKIVAAVKNSTGRQLNLQGDIKLSVIPWVALTLGPASLGNPPGFGDAPFLSFNRAEVRVKLLPLLSKRLEVARVVLDGLDLRLVKKPDGRANWQLNEKGETPKKQPTESGSGPSLDSIAGIAVTHGRLSYNEYVISNFDFETGAIAGEREVPIRLSLDANRGIAGETVALTAKLHAQENTGTKVIRVAVLEVSGKISRPAGTQLHYAFSAPKLEANLDQQTLSLPEFSLGLGDAKVTGKLSGTKIVDDLHLNGSLALVPLNLKEFMTTFGIALPKTQDPKVLSALSAGTSFGYDAQGVMLDNLEIKLDDTTLKGNIVLRSGKTEAVKYARGRSH